MDPRAFETLEAALDNLKDAVWSFDLTRQRYIYFNRRFNEIFGISAEELEAEPFKWRTTVHPDDYTYVHQETQRVYQNESIELEFRIVVNSRVRWILDRKSPVLDSNGFIYAVSGITTDITEKKQADLELKHSEYTYRYLFENNPNPLWIYDRKTLAFLAVNYAAIEEYGYTEEEFLSMKITDIRPPEEIPRLLEAVGQVKKKHSSTSGWKHRRKDGTFLDVIISGHGIIYNHRESEIIMVHNVTEIMKVREDMMIAKTNLDASINNIGDIIWSIDRDYRLLSANTAFRKMMKTKFDYDVELGRSILIPVVDEADVGRWKTFFDQALSGETVAIHMKIFESTNTHEIKMYPMYHNNEIVGVVCQGRDVQDALDDALRTQKQNSELKQIVELASHDIRGPVASLLGITPLFNETEPDDPFNADIINHVRNLAFQLDSILHKIVEKSYMLQQDNDTTDASQQNQSTSE